MRLFNFLLLQVTIPKQICHELSMISEDIFRHVLNTVQTLIFRPVLVLCGDDKQQQPFSKSENRTISVPNPFKNTQFLQFTVSILLGSTELKITITVFKSYSQLASYSIFAR